LEAEELQELAKIAHLIGRETEGAGYLARAHQLFLNRNETRPAAWCAFWLGFTAFFRGEHAQASGWLSRADRLLAEEEDCVEKGYLLLPQAMRAVRDKDFRTACEVFARAVAVGSRFGDKDLVAMGLQGQGRAWIRSGEIERGVALLD